MTRKCTMLTRAQIAEKLNVSKSTVAKWKKYGLFPASKRGRVLVYNTSDVDGFIDRGLHKRDFRFVTGKTLHTKAPENTALLIYGMELRKNGQSDDDIVYMVANAFEQDETVVRKILSDHSIIGCALSEAEKLRSLVIEFYPSDPEYYGAFDDSALGDMPSGSPGRMPKPGSNLDPYLKSLYDTPLLTRDQERFLFNKLNYAKYRASVLIRDLKDDDAGSIEECKRLLALATTTKNQIVLANLRLVVKPAHRFLPSDLYAAISDGNLAIMRSVDKFDVSKGNKFSTYAYHAIIKGFFRLNRTRSGSPKCINDSEELLNAPDIERESVPDSADIAKLRSAMQWLSDREREVIMLRFGLAGFPRTLKEIGVTMGITRERIRQIEQKALQRLSKFMVV